MLSASGSKKDGGGETFRRLRPLLSGIVRKFQRKRRQASNSFVDGLPEGITPAVLNKVCEDHFGETPLSYAYQHLSGWKASGAFRLLMKTRRGKEVRLIYKDAVYFHNQIPALVDLPIHPGPPEYAIYGHPEGELASYLPRVYLAEEVAPGKHYRYLLEDLGQKYHYVTGHKDLKQFSFLLPRLHHALREWADNPGNSQCFIQYGDDYSRSLQRYAQEKLENYSQHSDDPALNAVLNFLPQVVFLRSQDYVCGLQPCEPIHGDANFTNIHIHNQDPYQFRIVDWEWAGYGVLHADLAALLKSQPLEAQKTFFKRYMEAPKGPGLNPGGHFTYEENWRIYLWAQLERGLLDASFLAVQYLQTSHAANFSLPLAISNSLNQVIDVYQELSNERMK